MSEHFSLNSREVNFYRTSTISNTYHRKNRGADDGDSVPLMLTDTDDDEDFDTLDEQEYLFQARRARKRRSITPDCSALSRCCTACWERCKRKKQYYPRTLWLGRPPPLNQKFPSNVISNQKYNVITFLPLVLYGQFKFFLNFYFLVMALTQFVDALRVGYLYTYWAPLGLVVSVTMIREAIDDIRRRRRDREVNKQKYSKLTKKGVVQVDSASIRVGDLLYIEKNQRVPADMVFLRTTDKSGSCFIRTDQLDGETDWKLRLAVGATQELVSDEDLYSTTCSVYAERPQMDIHSFVGTFTRKDDVTVEDSLNMENTLWSNTVVASPGTVLGVVVYTGGETRSAMNTSHPHNKVGLLDLEVNNITKLLFAFVVCLSLIMMILKGFDGPWYTYFIRFIVLFSYIIPLSLRVNLDMGKIVYSWLIQRDPDIPDTVVRCTTIPEELGRIQYLLTDKTGTLTQNDMVFKRLHLGTVSFGADTMDDVASYLKTAYAETTEAKQPSGKVRRTVVTRVHEAVQAVALCHNVTPVYEDTEGVEDTEAAAGSGSVTYQASSPDEVALVTWTESVNLTLMSRDISTMTLRTPSGELRNFSILHVFPFTSETKRMGIIVREEISGEITFYMKGADVVMQSIVKYNDWLEEECGNMAREGLRTLVVGKKSLSEDQYTDFESRLHAARISVQDRATKVQGVLESLERDMDLLCLTGVEDKLQEGVRPTLELLRNAGIKVWMLTGDKLETATCIAKSSRLVSRTQQIHTFRSVSTRSEAHLELNAFRRKNDSCLVITGDSLDTCLKFYEHEFVELACMCPCVVVCRCSPTQKAKIVRLLKSHTGKQTCAIGDGGNDVSMIQAADAGIGLVGKEGRQASLAADFSLMQFSYLGKLLMVHGRYSYKRSAALSHFVIHRGLIISAMQAVFSSVFYFTSVSLFPSILMVGYSTIYTMMPVFSLVLDRDVSAEIAMTYPELYKDLTKGREMSYKYFFFWVLISLYQGGTIMYGALLLFESEWLHIVAITFTSLLLTELLMVALTVRTWHVLMVVSEILSLGIYIVSIVFLPNVFEVSFLTSVNFLWKVVVITSVSCIPLYILKYLRRKFSPPSYSKLQN